jgi:hypothetical protein
MQRHTCQLFTQPVFSESGKKLQFRVAGEFSGIDSALGKNKSNLAGAARNC